MKTDASEKSSVNKKTIVKAKKDIIDAFCRLSLVKPVNKITISSIMRRAGYSRGTFYLYFNNIADLQLYIDRETSINLPISEIEVVKAFATRDLALMIKNVILTQQSQSFRRAITWLNGDWQDKYTFVENMRRIFRKSFPGANVVNKAKIDFLIEYQIYAYMAAFSTWYRDDCGISLEEIAGMICQANVHGPMTIMHELSTKP